MAAIAERILVAADESRDGHHVVDAARVLVGGGSGRMTVVQVLSPAPGDAAGLVLSTDPRLGRTGPSPALDRLTDWLGQADPERITAAVAHGVPGVEIVRIADAIDADLIVLGRCPRSPEQRHLLGETADAVVRRSGHPVLFVSPKTARFRTIAVAADGSERAHRVLEQAHRLAWNLGARLTAVTVEPAADKVAAADAQLPTARTVRLAGTIRRLPPLDSGAIELTVRSGDPIEEVLGHCATTNPDLLVIGYRRGGPPKTMGPTEIARNLLYAAPCSVYTVPV